MPKHEIPQVEPIITRIPNTDEIASERGHEPVFPNTGPVFEFEDGPATPIDTIKPRPLVEEVSLHNRTIDLPNGHPLYDLERARQKLSINGEVLAQISFPGSNGPKGQNRRLSIVDFGDAYPKGHPIFYIDNGRGENSLLGLRTSSRYILMADNYMPDGKLAGIEKLPV